MKPTQFSVVCAKCKVPVGIVREVADSNPTKAGFYYNVPEPNPLPTACPKCKGYLTRSN